MIVVDKDALKANLSVLQEMCKTVIEMADTQGIEDTNLITFSDHILSTAHWMMHTSFISIPDPKPEPLKEIQEE